jgi:acetolactate synthase small subunit
MAKDTIIIERLVEMTQQEVLDIKKTMAPKQEVRQVGSEILSAIENLRGQIADVKTSTITWELFEGQRLFGSQSGRL